MKALHRMYNYWKVVFMCVHIKEFHTGSVLLSHTNVINMSLNYLSFSLPIIELGIFWH